jgi:hypothetical protein
VSGSKKSLNEWLNRKFLSKDKAHTVLESRSAGSLVRALGGGEETKKSK